METRTPGSTAPSYSTGDCSNQSRAWIHAHPSGLTRRCPLAAVVDGAVLCVHGGLSPDVRTIDQMRLIDRKQEIPHEVRWSFTFPLNPRLIVAL